MIIHLILSILPTGNVLKKVSVRVTLHQMEFGEPPKKRRRIYRNLKVVGFLLKL